MTLLAPLFARREFPLPHFEPAPLEFEDACEEPDELLLDQAVGTAPPATPAGARPLPTAGELHESIERHLGRESAGQRRADAADELRNALAELRRSLA